MKFISLIIMVFIMGALSAPAQTFKPAERVYKKTSTYVSDAFGGNVPKKATVWVIGDLRDDINQVNAGYVDTPVRYRYWKDGNRTLWVLENVARTMLFTTGVTVENGTIEDISVLTYRESRGHEIQNRTHRAQFYGAKITDDNILDKPINGISGSTLSANAMKRMARIALLLHNDVTSDDE
ncbi:MAG: FMN-binding protein [Kordiimonadaceae bacterium]|jgi:hypothetical protein|nr:FMN-binding protein [Kordiimonadaceae bacterium]MBT6031823.1 FMN-binding protein [Kordiimonadaceae bacterium]